MSYDDDDTMNTYRPRSIMTNEDALRIMVVIVTILMLIISLPYLFSEVYENPLPGIVLFGFIATILSLFYLSAQLQKMV